ncbi:MAG: type III-B CRISPR module RAMP protein Cmr4 [Methanobacteriales archaeon]
MVTMFKEKMMLFLYSETPIHPGSGTLVRGVADLPIQRERHTEFPIIQGSSLKGVLRHNAKLAEIEKEEKKCIFGSPDEVGGVSVTDARVLAYPIRSLKGVFGWITCPLALNRYKRDLGLLNVETSWNVPKIEKEYKALVCEGSSLLYKGHVYLEDLQLKSQTDNQVNNIVEDMAKGIPENRGYNEIREKLKKDLVVVSDEIFRDFVSLTTEIITRIQINSEKGTVKKGGLWSEEYLPTDTLMYSLILIPDRPRKSCESKEITERLKGYNEKILNIGGDETVGKGFVRLRMIKGEDVNAEKS